MGSSSDQIFIGMSTLCFKSKRIVFILNWINCFRTIQIVRPAVTLLNVAKARYAESISVKQVDDRKQFQNAYYTSEVNTNNIDNAKFKYEQTRKGLWIGVW